MEIKRINKYDSQLIDKLYNDYIFNNSCSKNKLLLGISKKLLLTDVVVYGVYKKSSLIGFFISSYINDVIVIHEVMMYKKFLFKKAINLVFEFFRSKGFKAIVTQHDTNTTSITDKHNIFKRINNG